MTELLSSLGAIFVSIRSRSRAASLTVDCCTASNCERVVLGKSATSLAGVHMEFVHHIVEDEVDGQEERQDDKREDGQQREESGEVDENVRTTT